MPAKASTSPVRGCSATTPPRRAAERGDRRLLDRQRDRRAHGRRPGAGCVRLSTRAPATSSPPGVPEQALVEDPLEARDADLGVGGHAERGELLAALGRDRAELADDLGRQQRGRGAVVALGQHRAVAGQQRGARGHLRHAAQALARREPGEDERARPVDAVAGGGQRRPRRRRSRTRAWGCGPARGRRAVLARLGGVDLRRRRGAQRVLVGGGEARARHAVAIGRR